MPSHLSIVCGWGAWRPTNFFAEQEEVAIWFGSGVEASIVSGNSGYYRWDTKSDLASLKPVYIFPTDLAGKDEKTMQAPYAAVRYDARSNELLIAATHGSSSNYRNTWLHFVDCASGTISRTIRLKDYYWFPALPVFPDKYAPEFEDIDEIELDIVADKEGKSVEINVADRDNMDKAIKLSLFDLPAPERLVDFGDEYESPIEKEKTVQTSLDGNTLTVVPLSVGNDEIVVRAESNGVPSYLSIPVRVKDIETGVENGFAEGGKMSITGRRFRAQGFNGHTMRVYTTEGILAAEFEVTEDDYAVTLPLPGNTYVIVDISSGRTLKCVIK